MTQSVAGVSQQIYSQTLARAHAHAQQAAVESTHTHLTGVDILHNTAAKASQSIMDTTTQMFGTLVDVKA